MLTDWLTLQPVLQSTVSPLLWQPAHTDGHRRTPRGYSTSHRCDPQRIQPFEPRAPRRLQRCVRSHFARRTSGAFFFGNITRSQESAAWHGVAARRSSTIRRVVSPHCPGSRWYGTAFAKSTMMPSTDRSTVGPTATEAIARVSAAIVRSSSPQRLNLASTSAASRAGRPRTFCAGISIGSSEVELTKRRSGCRSTTTRLTYQSPSAVSELVGMTSVAGSNEFSFRVGRSMTMSQSSCGTSDIASMVILKHCNRNQWKHDCEAT